MATPVCFRRPPGGFPTHKTPTQLLTAQDFASNPFCLCWIARVPVYVEENKELEGGGRGYTRPL